MTVNNNSESSLNYSYLVNINNTSELNVSSKSKSILIYLSFSFAGAPVAGVSGLKENNRTTCGLVVESADHMDHVGDWSCTLTIDGFPPDVGK